jgi:osmoprotectant transport system substrate-binding protein
MLTRTRSRTALLVPALALVLTACGGSDSDNEGGTDTAGPASSAGEELVVLEDEQQLQTVDNIAAAVRTEVLTDPLRQAIEAVTDSLDTDQLIALNRQVDLERRTPEAVAEDYLSENDLATGVSGGSGEIVVGAANFGENQILANLFAGALDAAGFDARVQPVTNREVYEPALENGQLDVVPEYVGTLTEFLNKKVNGPDAEAVASGDLDATVEALRGLAEPLGITVLEPSEAQDQNAFAVTKAFAEANDLTTLSDLADFEGELVLGGPPECPTRPFCQPGLEETYGIEFSEFVALDAGGPLTKTALRQGEIQVGLVFSSDGSLSSR